MFTITKIVPRLPKYKDFWKLRCLNFTRYNMHSCTIIHKNCMDVSNSPASFKYLKKLKMSTTVPPLPAEKELDYEQFIEKKGGIHAVIVDVREKKEIEDTGLMLGAINVPLGELEASLKLSEDEFYDRYSAKKPQLNEDVIFTCRSGNRSRAATHLATKLGYKCFNYKGGWREFAFHNCVERMGN